MAAQKRRSLIDSAWPNISTLAGKRDAMLGGAIAAGWIAGSYALGLGLLLTTGRTLWSRPEDAFEFQGFIITYAIMILMSSFFCWRIWKHQGYVSAITVLIWTIIEVITKFIVAPGRGLFVSIILTFAALNGVRGTLAYRHWFKDRKSEIMRRGELQNLD